MANGHLLPAAEGPTRQDEVAVAALAVWHVELIQMGCGAEALGQHRRLIVEARPPHVAVHFLQANEVGILLPNDLDNSFQPVAAIAADTLVNVISQQTHHRRPWNHRRSSMARIDSFHPTATVIITCTRRLRA